MSLFKSEENVAIVLIIFVLVGYLTLNFFVAPPQALSYSWRQVSGPSQAVIVSPNDSVTQVNSLIQGEYQFELTVTDAGGLSDADTVKVTVLPAISLPLKILRFTGVAEKPFNLIRWETTNEVNIDHFILEESKDGVNFSTVYNFVAKGISGGGTNSYSYQHYTSNKITYYRLNVVEFSNLSTFSEIIKISRHVQFNVSGINPIRDNTLKISIRSDKIARANLYAYDVNGRRVMYYEVDLNPGENRIEYRVDTYPAGTYILNVTCDGETISKKFIKL